MSNSKKPRVDLMIDLETLSQDVHRGIVVSACIFPFVLDEPSVPSVVKMPYNNTILHAIMVHFDIEDSRRYGRSQSTETMDFWSKHPEQFSRMMEENNKWKMKFVDGWTLIYTYIADIAKQFDVWVWAQGIDFDFPFMEGCFHQCSLYTPPYRFWQKMDARTYCNTAYSMGMLKESKRPSHDALDDCRQQIVNVRRAYHFLDVRRQFYKQLSFSDQV